MIHSDGYTELPDVSHLSTLEIESKLNQPKSFRESFNEYAFGISCVAFPASALVTGAISTQSITATIISGGLTAAFFATDLVTGEKISQADDMKEALSLQYKKNNKQALQR